MTAKILGIKRKLDLPQVPRKKLKKQIKQILKSNGGLKSKKIRRKLESALNLPKKTLDPRKTEINTIIGKVKVKLAGSKTKVIEISTTKSETVVKATPTESKIITSSKESASTPKESPSTPKQEPSKSLTESQKQWRTKHNVTLEDKIDLPAYEAFSDVPVESRFSDGYKGFTTPMPIQAQSWPYTLPKNGKQGRDCIGIAETGSGKTLAFILPGLLKLFTQSVPKNMRRNPRAMVLAPTRELANQIEKTLSSFQASLDVRSICVYGGVDKYPQLKAIRSGIDFVVATPGRLLAYVRNGEIDLSQVEYVVLDEADRMLDQGFVPDVTELVDSCQPKGTRQTMLFSATWPFEVQKLGRSFLESPVRITVSKDKDELAIASTVTQKIMVMKDWDKQDQLWEILNSNKNKKIIVFALYKKECANLEWSVKDWGFNCVSLHGNKDQRERTKCMNMFRNNKVRLLIATDVASRGLDVRDVELVVNFSFPLTVEDYVHRVGRTGRAGSAGDSITFFTQRDKLCARGLIELLEKAGEDVPKELFKLRCAKRFKRRH
jgi:ATP-dependent RNA helicase DBP3